MKKYNTESELERLFQVSPMEFVELAHQFACCSLPVKEKCRGCKYPCSYRIADLYPQRIIQARQMKGLDLHEMSDLMGCDFEEYIFIESGLRQISDHQMQRLCFITGMLPKWFEKEPLDKKEFPLKESSFFF